MTIQEYNDIYKNTVIKKMTIATSGGLVIRNTNIASENMSLEESLCSEQNLKFGCCEASCFKVRLLECNHSFLGEWLDVKQTIYTDEDGYLLLEDGGYLLTEDGFRLQLETADAFSHYGKFKVYSDKPTNDRMWRDLVCYDAMYDILNADMLPWYKTLTFPMTLKALRDSFFDYLQIPQQTTTLANDNFQTEGGFLVDGQLSGKTIINAICELNGVFGHISHEGVFEYISLPSADTIALDWYYDGTGAYEGYVVDNITGIRAIGSDTDAGTSVGTTDNVYIVNNNPLIYGTEGTPELETALTNLLNAIKDITYRPFNVTTYGNPMLPLGTNLVINTRDQVINSFVMSRKLNGIQALKDTYKAVGDENQPSDVNSLQSQIIRSRGKTHDMEVDVNRLKSTIYDPETGVVSVLEQTVERIVMKVDDNGNIVQVELGKDPDDESATIFKVNANNISFIADGKIELTSNSLEINSTNFKVDTAGNITCTGGTIGGFTIGNMSILNGMTSLSDTTHDGVYIGTDGIALGKGNFKVTKAGALTSKSGSIGGFTISTSSIYNGMTSISDTTHDGVYVGTDGIALGKGNFKVTNSGSLTAKSGTVGGFTIDSTSIRSAALTSNASGSVGLSTTDFTRTINSVSRTNLRFAIGSAFGVKNDGTLYCSGAVINGSIRATSFTADNEIDMYDSVHTRTFKFFGVATYGGETNTVTAIYNPRNSDVLCVYGIAGTPVVYNTNIGVLGSVTATAFINSSSKLVKENIKAIDDEKAKKLLELNVVDFDYIEGKGKKGQTGLIAEDVLQIIPNVVNVPDGYNETEVKEKIENGNVVATIGIDYTKLVPYLIRMVQIQQKELEELKEWRKQSQ